MANQHLATSLGIIIAALGLAYAPILGSQQRLLVVSGSEMQEPLQTLEARFEQDNPNIQIDLTFLRAPAQQATFVQFGFRPGAANLDLATVPDSPWAESVPGAAVNPPSAAETPSQETLSEIVRLWQRAN